MNSNNLLNGSSATEPADDRHAARLLKLLAGAGEAGCILRIVGKTACAEFEGRAFRFGAGVPAALAASGLVSITGDRMAITATGVANLARSAPSRMPFHVQHGGIDEDFTTGQGATIARNLHESPLARLYLRRDGKRGQWICEAEFQAGERLRSDFEKASLQPRISANWFASVGGRQRSDTNAMAEISDFTLDARDRVNAAIAALGPELSGPVLDICCFLKGLEEVERERQWPPRSAKLMLRTGLRFLVRHYGLETGKGSRGIRQWGADGYRPAVNGGKTR